MTDPALEPDWIRGVLPLLLLASLVDEPRHGYAIGQHLSGLGLGGVRVGTLYPQLNRLEAQGLVEARWLPGDGGPGRKAYALTDAGRDRLVDLGAGWHRFHERVTSALEPTRTKEQA